MRARCAAGLLALTLAAGACGGDDDEAGPAGGTGTTGTTGGATASTTSTTSSTEGPASTAASPTSGPAPTSAPEDPSAPLADGRHPVFLTGIDGAGRTIEVDVVQFLTGDEAVAAYQEEFPDDPEGPPNDYYIVNENPALRTLPVGDEVTVSLVRLAEDGDADLDPGTFNELPGYFAALPTGTVWLTVSAGTVVEIEEQYVP